MKGPLVLYDSNAFQAVVTGPLSKGGILTSSPQLFTVTFACVPFKYTKSDVEVTLSFQDNDMVSLYFQKECQTVGEVKEFNLLHTIYWIFIIIILTFVAVTSYFYIEKNKDNIVEFLNRMWTKIKRMANHYANKGRSGEEEHLKSEDCYEENDLVDIKIKTETKAFGKGNTNVKANVKYNNFTTDYGGI